MADGTNVDAKRQNSEVISSGASSVSLCFIRYSLMMALFLTILVPTGVGASEVFSLKMGISLYFYEVVLMALIGFSILAFPFHISAVSNKRMTWILIALASISLMLLTANRDASFTEVMSRDGRFIISSGLLFICCMLYASPSFYKQVLWATLLGLITFLLIILITYAFSPNTIYSWTGIQRMVFTNGRYAMFALPFVLLLLYSGKAKASTIALAVVTLTLIAAYVYLSGSRALFLILIVQYLYWEIRQGFRYNLKPRVAIVVALTLIFSVMVLQTEDGSYALNRFTGLISADDMAIDFSLLQRVERSANAFNLLLQNPLGLGLGSALDAGYNPIVRQVIHYYWVDIQYLTVAVKFGWLGLGAFIVWLGWLWFAAGKVYNRLWNICLKTILLGIFLSFAGGSLLTHSSMGIVMMAFFSGLVIITEEEHPT